MTAIPETAVETTQPLDMAALIAAVEADTGRPYQQLPNPYDGDPFAALPGGGR